ncbi:MAG: CRISPR-associated endonuclease Cas3 [Thermoleophilia bacterium]|nr:CRISPR-associated endonuclease Cas3 [Thermoleophilia bacterium]
MRVIHAGWATPWPHRCLYDLRVAGDVRISDVQAGRPVEGVYAVVRKQRRHDKNGDAYLVVELSDTTGRIEGRVWRNADWFDRNIQEGDRVRAVGKGTSFKDVVQLDIRRLDKLDEHGNDAGVSESFIPASTRDTGDLAGEVDFLTSEIAHPDLRALVEAVWHGPLRDDLLRSPATASDHHAHLGGLIEHSIAVATICLAAADRHPSLDRDMLAAAALVHDIGRVRELRSEDVIARDPAGSLVGHVLLGHELLLGAAVRAGIDTTTSPWWPKFVHAVSTHHGPVERCRTREAVVLASANSLDARLAQRDRI